MPFNPDEYLASGAGFNPDAYLANGSPPKSPLKIGEEGFGDALRETLKGTDWITRNAAGAGTAVGDIYQGAKQFFGAADPQQLEANRIMAEEAPVGSFAGNAALTAIPFGTIGQGLKGAAMIGAGYGALQPVQGDQSVANVLKGKLMNTGLGAAGGVAGQYVGDKIGAALANKAATRSAQQSVNQPIDKTLQDALAAGFKAPPTSVNPTWWNQLKEGIAGKVATAQTASNVNADLTDALSRKAVGLAKDAPLTSQAMQQIRSQAYQQGYEPVASLGTVKVDGAYQKTISAIVNKYRGVSNSFPGAAPDDVAELARPYLVNQFDAGDALQTSQFLRDQANEAFRAGKTGLGKASKDIAKAIEDQIERSLSANGVSTAIPIQINGQQTYVSPADLLKNFRDARKLMAKAHTVEDAIVEGGGTINAKKLAQRAQAGKPLTDELATIGNFANNFGKAMQPRAQVAGPAVSKLNSFAALMGGSAGGVMGGLPGAIAGSAAPFIVPPAMRSRLLSDAVQQQLLNRYGPSIFERGGNALAQNLPMGLTVGGLEAMGQ